MLYCKLRIFRINNWNICLVIARTRILLRIGSLWSLVCSDLLSSIPVKSLFGRFLANLGTLLRKLLLRRIVGAGRSKLVCSLRCRVLRCRRVCCRHRIFESVFWGLRFENHNTSRKYKRPKNLTLLDKKCSLSFFSLLLVRCLLLFILVCFYPLLFPFVNLKKFRFKNFWNLK